MDTKITQAPSTIIQWAIEQYQRQVLNISDYLFDILTLINQEGNTWIKENLIIRAETTYPEDRNTLRDEFKICESRELNEYLTYLSGKDHHLSWDDFFVVLGRDENYKRVETLDSAREFFTIVWFPGEYIENALLPFKDDNSEDLYEISILVDRVSCIPYVFLRPTRWSGDSKNSRGNLGCPKSITYEQWLSIVKNAYAQYDSSKLFFVPEMLTKDYIDEDTEEVC
jgi:hypothetical protein